jgi:hypothetical protein
LKKQAERASSLKPAAIEQYPILPKLSIEHLSERGKKRAML